MPELLIRNAQTILTMDDASRELTGADILIRDGVIAAIGPNLQTTAPIHDATGCVVTPGLVNTHHTCTKASPAPSPAGRTRCCSAG